jgi:glyoxylase-like metal-dependent hydrolase (beta-lactamase superfamily II)
MAKIYALGGNQQWLDGGAMFGNAPKTLWEKWVKPDSHNRIPLACRSLLIQERDCNILCEVGIGAFFEPKLADRYGVKESEHMLIHKLETLGIKDSEIDFVILSHLHFDHAGGLLPSYAERKVSGDRLLFPKAKYVVSQKAWERALYPHPRDQASFIAEVVSLLRDSKRMIVVDGDRMPDSLFEDRLSFFETHGHTPGHMHTKYCDQGVTVVFAGDLIPGLPWIHLPITMGYDRYAELVIDEKKTFLQKAIHEKWLVFFTHDETHAMARIGLDEKGRYIPLMGNIWKEGQVQGNDLSSLRV